jgi:cation diffusion facilitator family transporter
MEARADINKKHAALISLIIGVLMFFGKMGAYLLTRSTAVLSDAMESVVHIFATGFAFYSLHLSTKPPDSGHPYGHGKVEYFSAGFEGAMIIIAAISIIAYAVKDIIFGTHLEQLDTGAVIILGASIINAVLGVYLIRTGRKTKSLVLIADGKHVLTDSYTSIGAFIALILVLWTGIIQIDAIIAVIMALNILWTGKNLVRESVGGLMNETDTETLKEIARALEEIRRKDKNLIDLHLLRYWRSGNRYFVDFHLTIPYFLTVVQSHELSHKLDGMFKIIFHTNDVELLSHIEPCEPTCCVICRKDNCTVRKKPFEIEIKWDNKKITSLSKYSLI